MRFRIGRYEADRLERRANGQLCLVEVRYRSTMKMALRSVSPKKQRRLSKMARLVAQHSGKPVIVEVEAVGRDGFHRHELGIVHPPRDA
ncbi:MAG: hypothetical protein CMJ28_07515 [Phycisphaerae bacterium]|nr:hypothetical protein [Phycisphaerae bacterium]